MFPTNQQIRNGRDAPRMSSICLPDSRVTHNFVKATLEIEFMHQTIVQYVNKPASNTFTEIYTTISKAYQRRPGADGDLQKELDGVKRTLHETRRVTAIEYLCFKAPRKKKDNDAAGGTSEASSAT